MYKDCFVFISVESHIRNVDSVLRRASLGRGISQGAANGMWIL